MFLSACMNPCACAYACFAGENQALEILVVAQLIQRGTKQPFVVVECRSSAAKRGLECTRVNENHVVRKCKLAMREAEN